MHHNHNPDRKPKPDANLNPKSKPDANLNSKSKPDANLNSNPNTDIYVPFMSVIKQIVLMPIY